MDPRIIKANKKIAKILAREVVREVKKKEKEKGDFFKWQEKAFKEEVKLQAKRIHIWLGNGGPKEVSVLYRVFFLFEKMSRKNKVFCMFYS